MTIKHVLVTGGAGYIGAILVPMLLDEGYRVTVVDLCLHGPPTLPAHPALSLLRADIRQPALLESVHEVDAVIHLAGVSNDPDRGLDRRIGLEINLAATARLAAAAREAGVRRFIYPSSCSVYGMATGTVTEEAPVHPLSDYAYCKAECERIVLRHHSPSFCCMILRPATVCGFSPRQRLDLTVNSFTNQAYITGSITVPGPARIRPGITVRDLARLYILLLTLDDGLVGGQIFNAAYENRTVAETARLVAACLPGDVQIITSADNDGRTYAVDSSWLTERTGFRPRYSVRDAVLDLIDAFASSRLSNTLTDPRYHNKFGEADLSAYVTPLGA